MDGEMITKRLGKYRVRKAGNALTITLPKEWVDDYNVSQGDWYVITDALGTLIIARALS